MASRTIASMRRLVLINFVILYSASLAVSQIAGGLTETTNTHLGGNNYIVGTVFAPDGQPITTRMRLRLNSPTWGEILAMTDDRGQFVFSGVGAGTYTITIDREKEYLPVSQQVEIVRARSTVPETYTVTIRLQAVENTKLRPSVISAANAGVPEKALKFYEKAAKLVDEKDYQGAIKQLKLAVAEYPAFVNAYNQMGVLYLRLDELDKADAALREALKINPEAYEPLVNRAVTLFRMAKFKEAETVLRTTLKLKPESAVAHYYLGRTLNKLGRNGEAETALVACVKLSPEEFKEAHRLLAAIYLDQGMSQRVVEELETYLKLVPTAPDAENLRKVIEQIKNSPARP